jgi:hypothetical protein
MGIRAADLVHVIFTDTGIPSWFGPEPVAGSEPVALEDLRPLLPEGVARDGLAVLWRDILIRHCRLEGRWYPRLPEIEASGAVSDMAAGDAVPAEEENPRA